MKHDPLFEQPLKQDEQPSPLRRLLDTLSAAQKTELSLRSKVRLTYLYALANGRSVPNVRMAFAIEDATNAMRLVHGTPVVTAREMSQ